MPDQKRPDGATDGAPEEASDEASASAAAGQSSSDQDLDSQTWRQRLDDDTEREVSAKAGDSVTGPGLVVLFHPDLTRVGEFAPLSDLGTGSALSRTEPVFHGSFSDDYRPLADPHLSRKPLTIAQDGDQILIDPGPSGSTVLVDGVPIAGREAFPLSSLNRGLVLELAQRVVLLLRIMPLIRPRSGESSNLFGCSAEMDAVRQDITRVASSDLPVLIRGETGTGKELVAKAIHDQSGRSGKAWTPVNLGALPAELAGAELFGSTAGAFTGARARPGLFRQSEGGTLFLDEVGEANAEVQVALLRVLQEGMLRPIGSDREEKVDVRIVAATDSDLATGVATGRLKAPLLQRLAGYEINIPALRTRRDDIGVLLVHFLRMRLDEMGQEDELLVRCKRERPWLPARLVTRLALNSLKGNVRQLRHFAEQLVVRSWEDEQVDPESTPSLGLGERSDIAEPVPESAAAPRSGPPKPKSDAHRDPMDVSEDELVEAMQLSRWEVSRAARHLGVARSSLYGLIEECPRLRKGSELSKEEIEEAQQRAAGRLTDMVEQLQVSRVALKARMRALGLEK